MDENRSQTGSSLPIPSGLLRVETFCMAHRLPWPTEQPVSASLCLPHYYNYRLAVSVPRWGGRDTLHHLDLAECSNHWLNIICWTKEHSELLKWRILRAGEQTCSSLFPESSDRAGWSLTAIKESTQVRLWAWWQGPCLVAAWIPGPSTGSLSK